jgi:CHASE3 domain sensor protein
MTESPEERKIREELEETKKELEREQILRRHEREQSEIRQEVRERKAADNTAQIVLFGGCALAILVALFK